MKKYLLIILCIFVFVSVGSGGIQDQQRAIVAKRNAVACGGYTSEDFTGWAEQDSNGTIAITDANTATATLLDKDDEAYLSKDKGAAYFSGDFTVRFKVNFSVINTSHLSYPWAITNELDDIYGIKSGGAESDDYIAVQWYESSGSQWLRMIVCEDGAVTASGSTDLAASTVYYITVIRDDNGGANSTGLTTMYVCTTDYCTSGGNLVTSEPVNSGAGEQNDFQYEMVLASHNSGSTTNTASYTVEDLEWRLCY